MAIISDDKPKDEEFKKFEEIVKEIKEKKKKAKMITDENSEIIDITYKTYKDYIGKYFGGCCFLIVTNFAMQLYAFFDLAADYVIGDWTVETD